MEQKQTVKNKTVSSTYYLPLQLLKRGAGDF